MRSDSSKNNCPKAIAIIGPTASGKSDLAVEIALRFEGEVVSADSRQVYKGLDIGTGKITAKEMQSVPHHLLDVADPRRKFSVTQYKKLAEEAIDEIIARGKTPILCGGTGFYAQTVIDNVEYPDVPPNDELRERLKEKTAEQLFGELKTLDPNRASTIDAKNPRRLIRAIEIASKLGHTSNLDVQRPIKYCVLIIGISVAPEMLKNRIHDRLLRRIDAGMIEEAEDLRKKGLSFERMEELGLEYRYLGRFLKGEISKERMISELETEIWHYAKRQMTWFKRDKRIKWFKLEDKEAIFAAVESFLNQLS